MRRTVSGDGRWLNAAEQRAAAMRPQEASAAAASDMPGTAPNDAAASPGTGTAVPWASGPSSHFQLPDSSGGARDATEAAHSAGTSAASAFPPHAAQPDDRGSSGSSTSHRSSGQRSKAEAGGDALRNAAAAEATTAKAAVSGGVCQSDCWIAASLCLLRCHALACWIEARAAVLILMCSMCADYLPDYVHIPEASRRCLMLSPLSQVMQSAAESALGGPLPQHMPGRLANVSQVH